MPFSNVAHVLWREFNEYVSKSQTGHGCTLFTRIWIAVSSLNRSASWSSVSVLGAVGLSVADATHPLFCSIAEFSGGMGVERREGKSEQQWQPPPGPWSCLEAGTLGRPCANPPVSSELTAHAELLLTHRWDQGAQKMCYTYTAQPERGLTALLLHSWICPWTGMQLQHCKISRKLAALENMG